MLYVNYVTVKWGGGGELLLSLVSWYLWMQALLAFRARCFGTPPPSPRGSVKSSDARCVIQTLFSSRRSWELGVPSQLYGPVPGVGFVVRVCLSLSYPFWYCEYFLICLICKSHSGSFWISLRGTCPLVSCTFSASMEGGRFKSLLYCHLGSSPQYFHILKGWFPILG